MYKKRYEDLVRADKSGADLAAIDYAFVKWYESSDFFEGEYVFTTVKEQNDAEEKPIIKVDAETSEKIKKLGCVDGECDTEGSATDFDWWFRIDAIGWDKDKHPAEYRLAKAAWDAATSATRQEFAR